MIALINTRSVSIRVSIRQVRSSPVTPRRPLSRSRSGSYRSQLFFCFPGYQNGKLLINARGETAADKKAFSESLKERGAILPAAGFYEWDAAKTKYLVTVDAQTVLYLCGLYKIIDGRSRFVILTRAANESMIEK